MKKHVLIIIGLWFSVCLIYSIFSLIPYILGKEVYLKTIPIDPRDLMRGQYVNLNFEISEFRDYQDFRDKIFTYGKTKAYVELYVDENNFAHFKALSLDKPKEGLFIKAQVKRQGNSNYKYRAKYDIESYYANPKKAKELEKELQNGGVAKVKIDKYGRAKVIKLLKKEDVSNYTCLKWIAAG